MKIIRDKIDVYTDGSCYPNDGTGEGGWCSVAGMANGEFHIHYGHYETSTNNIAEIGAVLHAMDIYPNATIYTDSMYVVNGYNKWMNSWAKKGWVKPLKNNSLWQNVYKARENFSGKIKWVKGHNGTFLNELADMGALLARKKRVPFEMVVVSDKESLKEFMAEVEKDHNST